MIKTDYLVVGGGIAGTTAAEIIRQRDFNASISLISKEPYPLYSRVLLPEFVQGKVGLEKVMLRSLSDYKKSHIGFYAGESVNHIDAGTRMVRTTRYTFLYKKLLIASGGKVNEWPFEAEASGSVFRFQTLDDAKRIINFFQKRPTGRALVIGGGFITLEFLELLIKQGYKTTLLIRNSRFWYDYLGDVGFEILSNLWAKNSIDVLIGDEISHIKAGGDQVKVQTHHGHCLDVDFIGVGIGLERDLDFIGQSDRGIEVNEYLKTKTPNIWAAGDVALYPDIITGQKGLCRNWSGAFMQGRIAGMNMSGGQERFALIPTHSIGHLGYAITFVGDILTSISQSLSKSVVVSHINRDANEYVRIFEVNGKTQSAVLINAQQWINSIAQAIKNKTPGKELIHVV